jgi:hypothetical protein
MVSAGERLERLEWTYERVWSVVGGAKAALADHRESDVLGVLVCPAVSSQLFSDSG